MGADCYHDICLDEPCCILPEAPRLEVALATCDVCGWCGPESEFNIVPIGNRTSAVWCIDGDARNLRGHKVMAESLRRFGFNYYVATKAFEFGGVSVREGQPVPCHRAPWSTLLQYGNAFVREVK